MQDKFFIDARQALAEFIGMMPIMEFNVPAAVSDVALNGPISGEDFNRTEYASSRVFIINLPEQIKEGRYQYALLHQYVRGLNGKSDNGTHYQFSAADTPHRVNKRHAYRVSIPHDATVRRLEPDVFESDKIIIMEEMDEMDKEWYIKRFHYLRTREIIPKKLEPRLARCLLHEDGMLIEHIEEPTYAQKLHAVHQNGVAIQHIKEPDERIREIAVSRSGLALKFIKNPTDGECHAAVKQNGLALEHVPVERRSYDLCLMAVKRYGIALRHVPAEIQCPEICQAAVTQSAVALEYVLDQTEEICRSAVTQLPSAIGHVLNQKEKICWLALNIDKAAYMHIRAPTEEMSEFVLRHDGYMIYHVPATANGIIPERFRLLAVQQNGLALQGVPAEQRSLKVCRAAVAQNPAAKEYVPQGDILTMIEETTMEDIDPARAELQQRIVKLVSR